MPRVNLSVKEAQSFAPIPDGTYPAEVTDFSDVQQGPKSSYITAELTINDGEHSGRKMFTNLPLEGKGAGITANFIAKCTGNEVEVGEDAEDLDFDTDDLIGSQVQIVIKNEEYPEGSGDFRPNVKRVLAPGEASKATASSGGGSRRRR